MSQLLRIAAATAFAILCTFLPFLPGRYDSLALSLSVMAQLIGKVGLVLVPVGVLWFVSEYRRPSGRKRYGFAVTTMIASSVAWVLASLIAITDGLVERRIAAAPRTVVAV